MGITYSGLAWQQFTLDCHPFHPNGMAVGDPFRAFPAEMIYEIVRYLPIECVGAVSRASPYINNVCQDNVFWKHLIKISISPWFWEFRDISERLPENVNYKRLFLWLEHITRPKVGRAEGIFSGIANRRRIWHVCEEVRAVYYG